MFSMIYVGFDESQRARRSIGGAGELEAGVTEERERGGGLCSGFLRPAGVFDGVRAVASGDVRMRTEQRVHVRAYV
jgi:hypothetical protein